MHTYLPQVGRYLGRYVSIILRFQCFCRPNQCPCLSSLEIGIFQEPQGCTLSEITSLPMAQADHWNWSRRRALHLPSRCLEKKRFRVPQLPTIAPWQGDLASQLSLNCRSFERAGPVARWHRDCFAIGYFKPRSPPALDPPTLRTGAVSTLFCPSGRLARLP